MNKNITAAKAGEQITLAGARWPVLAACLEKHTGHWHCLTHKQSFISQFDKDGHIHTGKHKLVWICHLHGPEQP